MPVHNWDRVDANLFHDFHQTWTIGIRNVLNGGLLPRGYSALVEQHAAGLVPDVIGRQRRTGPERPIEMRAYVEPIGIGDELPDMPAYLDADSYVPVPLEASYQATWDSCPEDMRQAVEAGILPEVEE